MVAASLRKVSTLGKSSRRARDLKRNKMSFFSLTRSRRGDIRQAPARISWSIGSRFRRYEKEGKDDIGILLRAASDGSVKKFYE
jgi:hypothetical protein